MPIDIFCCEVYIKKIFFTLCFLVTFSVIAAQDSSGLSGSKIIAFIEEGNIAGVEAVYQEAHGLSENIISKFRDLTEIVKGMKNESAF